jgi:uncharacterized RDD family membrane protein YckC
MPDEILENPAKQACGLMRRFAAIAYDLIQLFAVLFAATAMLMPFTHGQAISSHNLLYPLYLLAWSYIFFVWQWSHGGQTLGMRAWKIKLYESSGHTIGWGIASKRFFLAMLSWLFGGLGYLWVLFDLEKRTFHDRYSGTRLYKIDYSRAGRDTGLGVRNK